MNTKTPIEDELQPETVNELALIQRIRDLKAEFLRAGKMPSYHDFSGTTDLTATVSAMADSIRVPLAVGAAAYEDTKRHGYVIRAEVRGGYGEGIGEAFGHRVFIDKGTLYTMNRYGIMRYLDEVRKKTDRQLVQYLTDGRQ